MTTILNIGLNIEGKPFWTLSDAILAVNAVLPITAFVTKSQVSQSATEQTAVIELTHPLTEKEANAICYVLKQDCIAQLANGEGVLWGPKADEWGPFNPEYFLTF